MADVGGPDDPRLELTIHSADDETVIVVDGEVDIATSGLLRTTIERALEVPPGRLVFDLSAVPFLDSSGISALLSALDAVESVKIRNPSPAAKLVIEATGLSEVLPCE
ncbi:MAG: hypothetical protein JWL73_1749 [Actinomycetia bacterium]|nr:hypothetical protein [Actinomycetes bacterium]